SSFFTDDSEDNLWTLFETALRYSETNDMPDEFSYAFNRVLKIKGNGLARITMGLYWIRPRLFMTLDSRSREYIPNTYDINVPPYRSEAEEYLTFNGKFKEILDDTEFYEVS